MLQYVKIYACPDKGMVGNDLRRLRDGVGLSQKQLSEKLQAGDWEIDQKKISRWEKFGEKKFYIHSLIMIDLLKILNASTLPPKYAILP